MRAGGGRDKCRDIALQRRSMNRSVMLTRACRIVPPLSTLLSVLLDAGFVQMHHVPVIPLIVVWNVGDSDCHSSDFALRCVFVVPMCTGCHLTVTEMCVCLKCIENREHSSFFCDSLPLLSPILLSTARSLWFLIVTVVRVSSSTRMRA